MKVDLALLLVMALVSQSFRTGCTKDGNIEEYKIAGISVNKNKLILKKGTTQQLKAAAIPSGGIQPVFLWRSANDEIATVNDGFVKGISKGETIITVSFRDKKTEIPVKVTVPESEADKGSVVLFDESLDNNHSIPELILNGAGKYSADGLDITHAENIVRLNKFYAIAERKVQYRVKFSGDAKAVFSSSQGDFKSYIDVENKCISIATNPVKKKEVNFLQEGHEYLIEIYHIYQRAKLRVEDIKTGESAEIVAINDGQGGVGKGASQIGFSVGMQWDYYCFGLISGTSIQIQEIKVLALKKKVKLLIYGDSITQPEAYFSTENFPKAWTQRIINRLNGNAMSSGRGGARIDMILKYIKNELPFIEAKYVMVTIGTNGGNTEAKLMQLVNYIQSQGAIPILNNIPCNESGTQVKENKLIELVRTKSGVKGCKFDIATSLSGDGKKVNKSLMFWEDYSGSYGWQIYHHPNGKGGKLMFERTLTDIPEIYN